MRSFVKILLFLMVCTTLFSCAGSEADICELLTELCDENGGEYGKGILYFDATRNTGNGDFCVLSEDEFGFLYSGKKEPPACINRIAGYAVRLPLDDNGYEIHIIECVNRSDTEEVAAMVQSRIDRLQGAEILQYAPESYEMYFRGAEVYIRGRYVFLLATPDNEAAVGVIKVFLRAF